MTTTMTDPSVGEKIGKLGKIFPEGFKVAPYDPATIGPEDYIAVIHADRTFIFPNRVEYVAPILDNMFISRRRSLRDSGPWFDPATTLFDKDKQFYAIEIPVIGQKSEWPVIGNAGTAVDIVMTVQDDKDIVYFVRHGLPDDIVVVRMPFTQRSIANAAHEHDMLCKLDEAEAGVSPKPLGAGTYRIGNYTQVYFSQSFIHGRHPPDLIRPEFMACLDTLRLQGVTVSAATLAEPLKERAAGLNIPDRSRERFLQLLGLVTDTTEMPAAVGHLDWWNENALINSEGRLLAIDWTYAKTCWLSAVDMLQGVFSRAYLKSKQGDFGSVYTEKSIAYARKNASRFLPPGGTDLEQLMALHFCQHYADRVDAQKGLGVSGTRKLDKILHTEWPAALLRS